MFNFFLNRKCGYATGASPPLEVATGFVICFAVCISKVCGDQWQGEEDLVTGNSWLVYMRERGWFRLVLAALGNAFEFLISV